MISNNVNIQQHYDGGCVNNMDSLNMDALSATTSLLTNNTSSTTAATTTSSSTIDNGFSIYNRNINFCENSNYTPLTKDNNANKKLATSHMEPNLLLKNANNNNSIIDTIMAREVIENVHNYSKVPYYNNNNNFYNKVNSTPAKTPNRLDGQADDTMNDSGYPDPNNEDDEDEDDDDEESDGKQKNKIQSAVEKTEKTTPDHHARRPMNAFLIFCKRHRAIVREKYPNLENRSITKILGDWWANIDKDEKTCYTSLAKQYKDAFFSANPNFKWYKLPAPPLRTLTTRPGNADRPLFQTAFAYANTFETLTKDNLNEVQQPSYNISTNDDFAEPRVHHNHHHRGIFKLADETEMGGLNSLMIGYDKKSMMMNVGNNNLGEEEDDEDEEEDDDEDEDLDDIHNRRRRANELQSALGETSTFISETITPLKAAEPFLNMRHHAANMELKTPSNMQQIIKKNNNYYKQTAKRKLRLDGNTERLACQPSQNLYEQTRLPQNATTTASVQLSAAIDFDQIVLANTTLCTPEKMYDIEADDGTKKSSRACKGKRYLEFMQNGKISPMTKKQKTQSIPVNNGHNGKYFPNDYKLPKIEYEILDHMYAAAEQPLNDKFTKNASVKITSPATAADNLLDVNNMKLFDASDFDLEEKIKALPALSLDKYLSRKRETKKKKKISSKRPVHRKSPQTILEAKERMIMVGSQKRKARKESITRRDVMVTNSTMANKSIEFIDCQTDDVVMAANNILALQNDAYIDDVSGNKNMILQNQTTRAVDTAAASDLFILATLAEKAATYEN